MTRGAARLALRFHNDQHRYGVKRRDLVTLRRAIGIAEPKAKPLPRFQPVKRGRPKKNAGLDDGPLLPGRDPRPEPMRKPAAERAAARAKAWETRRARYGASGHG